jgi:hypothetical protein
MSGKLAGLQRRADKIEQELAERAEKARQAWLAKCNCRPWTVVGSAEELEKELNLRCPNHGFRRLGKVVDVNSFNRGEPPRWLDEMLATYNANLEQAEREPAPEPPDF